MLIYLYIFIIIFVYPPLEATTIGVITCSNYVGDREVAWRIKMTGEKLGWKVIIDEERGSKIKDLPLDWVISLLPNCEFLNPHCPNYLVVFHPFNYLDENRKFLSIHEKYDGYLLTINDRENLEQGLKEHNKEFYYIPFYPSIYQIPYKELEFEDLFVMIPVWGNRLKDFKYRELFKLLSQSDSAVFYGVNSNADIISRGYRGSLPFDGESVINVIQKHGLVLVIHSDIHNRESIPTSRIFEAAGSSAVIISDENPFVKQHFGDSVFYIDTSLPVESIIEQILDHLMTIQLYPELALEMSRKAHQIFIESFTMENQLLNLELLNKKVSASKGL